MLEWIRRVGRESARLIELGKVALGRWPSDPKHSDSYWGVCPHCRRNDGYLNLGRNHWFVCHRHRVRWLIGENLFSTWRFETPEDWKANSAVIGGYAVVSWEDICTPPAASLAAHTVGPAVTTDGDQ